MYVTRPLSLFRTSPGVASTPPPLGPSSGILVIEDEEPESEARCCWGLCKNTRFYDLPFPQNRRLTVEYTTGVGENRRTDRDYTIFIPVINQPLSANRYYVVRASGKHKGKTCKCSKEEEKTSCCFCSFIHDVEPAPFDYRDIYQQVEVVSRNNKFYAKAVVSDGYPPTFLRRKAWRIYTSVPTNYYLDEALGLNASLRNCMPDLDFGVSTKQSQPVAVGKWYCPFIFIKEEDRLKDQMKRFMFYEITLQQFWEQIYTCENYQGNSVEVNTSVRRHMAMLNGDEPAENEVQAAEGVIWFKPVTSMQKGLGLSMAVWERMTWEEARGGWVGGQEVVERVERIEVYGGQNGWQKFGCYVLIERFVLRRMDGSTALTCDFKHINKIQTKWE